MVHREGSSRQRRVVARVLAAILILAAATLVGGCGIGAAPTPHACDGVAAEMGGCDADQPTFTGTTCAEVGEEWGAIVDTRVLAVIDGPAAANGMARSVLLRNAMVLAFVRAADHMGKLGILATCGSAEFLGAAEPRFSPELRSSVGGAMYDGEPVVTYTEFLTDALNVVKTLDSQ